MSPNDVIDVVENRAAELLHGGGADDFGSALWATLSAAEPDVRARYLFALRAAHAELEGLRDEQRERERQERLVRMVNDEVAASLRPTDSEQ
jgi:hypothetical protein